jgi:hypothetical protein
MIIHSGVPQGSVLSPSLFNYFTSDFPQAPLSESFADDFNIGASSLSLSSITFSLNDSLAKVEVWADAKKLTIAPHKSSVILFTPDPHQTNAHPQVFYKGDLIPLNKTPKNLGNVLDSCFNSSHHVADIDSSLSRSINILKALSGSTWGQSKETILATYKQLLRPKMDFGCGI